MNDESEGIPRRVRERSCGSAQAGITGDAPAVGHEASAINLITRILFLAFVALAFSGCFSPGKMRIVDVPARSSRPTIAAVKAIGDELHISVVQDGGVFIAGVKAQVIQGDVYLSTVCISSVVHATEFTVALSGNEFPRDWKQRLYWIEGDSISSPVNPMIEHVREIERSKIVLQ
jgi:hypothetical protein